MNYKEAKLKIEQEDSFNLGDFVVNKRARVIAVKHFDGSYLEFHSASFKKLDKEWMAIYTEHHGNFVYHFEDIKWIKEQKWNKLIELYRYQDKETDEI